MDSCVSETTSNASDDFTARDEFLRKNRSLRPSGRPGPGPHLPTQAKVCLNHVLWSNLPEELLIHIFARLPVKNILQICSLSKAWRSIITSPQFQQAFSEASLVRIFLLASNKSHHDTIFFSQENKEESFLPNFNPCYSEKLFEESSHIVGTTSGLICVIKCEEEEPRLLNSLILGVRVFVMNMVTGICRELPSPHITTLRPTLVQMKANVNGGYTITFIYTKHRSDLKVTSWQVYDSVNNKWSKDEGRAIADFKDVEAFNMCSWGGAHFDVPATFHKKTKVICILNLHEKTKWWHPWVYPSNPNGHVHNVSGKLYELCTREGRHGIWRLVCSSKWEMVCECPVLEGVWKGYSLEGVWTCLRVMNDLVVLIIKLPMPYEVTAGDDEPNGVKGHYRLHGGIVKVFHMPTKTWHNFPEDEHFTTRFRFSTKRHFFDENPFLGEIRFDSIP